MDLWVTLPYYAWAEVKSSGSFDGVNNMEDHEGPALDWFKDCVKQRLALAGRPRTLVYCTLRKPPVHWWYPPKRVVVRVRVHPSRVLRFDDRMYVEALNCGLGGQYPKPLEPLVLCTEDAADRQAAGTDEEACLKSYERMFDFTDPARRSKDFGPVDVRAFATDLTRADVRRVWVYRNTRRLRGKSLTKMPRGGSA